jgi:hypothetical protein
MPCEFTSIRLLRVAILAQVEDAQVINPFHPLGMTVAKTNVTRLKSENRIFENYPGGKNFTRASIIIIVARSVHHHEARPHRRGHRMLGAAHRTPDHFIEQQIVGLILFREIEFDLRAPRRHIVRRV